ncbi:MAG: hypothetical protein IT462_08350 [Planctomycetes bacterium]|nr:hypothetical protein [Planctomycetota bacterium]
MKYRIFFSMFGAAGIAAVLSLMSPTPAQARIKLATLPARDKVSVRFDHPTAVLVEEERTISLQKDVNMVDFSWAGTTIDKGSIVFRPVKADSKVVILSTSYPPGENALTWAVYAPAAGSEAFRISYLMGNIQRETSYTALVSKDESTCTLRHNFTIRNWSGEAFDAADFITREGKRFEKAMTNGEAKKVLVNKWDGVKLKKEYVYDTTRHSEGKVLTDYVMMNARDSGLGQIPLEFGKVRIYQDDGKGTTAFTGEDWGKFTPIGDELRLNIGIAQDIKIELKKMVNDRENVRGNVFDTNEVDEYEVKNFKDTAATVVFVVRVQGEWAMQNDSAGFEKFERMDNETIKFWVPAPAKGTPVKLKFHYKRLNNW